MPKSIPWLFVLLFHILVGPLLCLFLFSLNQGYPNITDVLYGFIGMVILVVPLFVAFIFGLVPFILLSVLTMQLIRSQVAFWKTLIISTCSGALLGYILPYCLAFVFHSSSSLNLTAMGAIVALLCNLACFARAARMA